MLKICFILFVLSSLWYFFHETYKRMSFYDKMLMWKIIWNLVAIVFFCTIGVDLYFYFTN